MADQLSYGGMDPAVLQRVLAAQGAAPTQDNLNRLIQFAGANPDILERYSMSTAAPQADNGRNIRGGGGGQDNNTALLQLSPAAQSVNNSIAATEAQPPPGRVEVGQPQRATAPPQPARSAAPPAQKPLPPGLPQGTPPPAPARTSGYEVEPDTSSMGGGSSGLEWLLPALLGPAAAAYLMNRRGATAEPKLPPQFENPLPTRYAGPEATYVGPMDRGGGMGGAGDTQLLTQEQRRALGYDPKIAAEAPPARVGQTIPLDNRAPSTTRNSPELEAAGKAKADRTAKVAADVANENERQRHLMEQMRARQAMQEGADATVRAARNVFRR